MQSNTVIVQGTSRVFTQVNDGPMAVSEGVVESSRKTLTVINGNVRGDRKSPNPITFTSEKAFHGNSRVLQEVYTSGTKYTTRVESRSIAKNLGTMAPIIPPDFAQPLDRSMEKIYDQLRGKVDLAVDVAEGAQTIRMLKGTLNLKKFISGFLDSVLAGKAENPWTVVRDIKRYTLKGQKLRWLKRPRTIREKRKARLSKGQVRLDYITSKWLEARYGWEPLVRTIWEAANNLDMHLRAQTVRVEGKSGVSVAKTIVSGLSTFESPLDVTHVEMSTRVKIECRFKLPGGPLAQDWTSCSPYVIGWELFTLSFVVDWVLNIGSQLKLWENHKVFSEYFLSGYRTDSYRSTEAYTFAGSTFTPPVLYANGEISSKSDKVQSGSSSRTVSYKDRKILNALPTPAGFRVNVNLNAKRLLDAAALMQVMVAKRLR